MTFDQFLEKEYPRVREEYELFIRVRKNPESLIGVHVIAIKSGFSCGSEGGTRMTIDEVNGKHVHLAPTKGIKQYNHSELGWGCDIEEFHKSVKLADPVLAAATWNNPYLIPIQHEFPIS